MEADFSDPDSPAQVMKQAVGHFGHVDILIINHTHDTLKTLEELTAEEIDRHLSVNVRATLLLIQEYEKQHDGRAGGLSCSLLVNILGQCLTWRMLHRKAHCIS